MQVCFVCVSIPLRAFDFQSFEFWGKKFSKSRFSSKEERDEIYITRARIANNTRSTRRRRTNI
jgi:hypothetical protein